MDVILLNSGGLDSLASAIIAKQNNHTLRSVHVKFNYPIADIALTAAQAIADEYCDSHKIINLTDLDPVGTEYGDRFRPVPYQQAILCTIGADIAQKTKLTRVISGVRRAEIFYSIDSYKEHLEMSLNQFRISEHNDLHFMFPLQNIPLNEKQVFYDIIKDSPVLHDTVSCLNVPACGICIKCLFRQEYSI